MPWHVCVLCTVWVALCLELLVFVLCPSSVHQSARFTRCSKVSWVQGEGRPSLPCQTHTHTGMPADTSALGTKQGLQLLRLSW